ncbi:MAG: alpha-galactosidase [Limisphaerales bacterium]
MQPHWLVWFGSISLTLLAPVLAAAPVSGPGSGLGAADQAEARAWVSARFLGASQPRTNGPALVVLANHDPVQKNSRHGRPMRLVNREYSRGLYCHAPSRLLVRLPAAGATFSAIVGVDSNEQTSGGRGSVVFSVQVGGAGKYRSEVVREGMAPQPVKVDLDGAREFWLQIEETTDGISCDQADWAEARVTLEDGQTLWLADLPMLDGAERAPYTTELPFHFVYDGRPMSDWLAAADGKRVSKPLDARRTEHLLSWTEPRTGLEVRCVAVEYQDYPTVEWTLHFKNTGTTDTPILAGIEALATRFERREQAEFVLHHHKGTFVRADDFEPLTTVLKSGSTERFAPPAGRPLGHVFPYFNLEWQPDAGVIAVVGWPGQWFAEFKRDEGRGLGITAGQEQTHLRLQPGEEIRSPLVVLQFWHGDWLRAQNVWRRWMIAHNLPRPGGQEPRPLLTPCSSHQYGEMINADEASQKMFIDRYLEEKLNPDYWWMDAGWYVHDGKGWPNTGTWEVDRKRFPNGLRAITDHAHAKGLKSIVWFEPERVAPGTFLYTNNPAWLLGRDGNQKLLDLGHPEAHAWLVDHISRTLTEQGIDLYRQDYNIDPLAFWREADAGDRQGITENHYVTGYLAYWDELLRRHPGLVIDSCASGGHRNDLETMRRSLPFLRSDFIQNAVGNQCHTYGLSFWLPYHGTGASLVGRYDLRSAMACPHFIACWDVRDRGVDYDLLRRTVGDWRQYSDLYLGDYQPLTPYSTANDAWMAWQFHLPEQGRGMVQAFRRAGSVFESARFRLTGLDPDRRYVVTDFDRPDDREIATGRQLMERGLLVSIPTAADAVTLAYHFEN